MNGIRMFHLQMYDSFALQNEIYRFEFEFEFERNYSTWTNEFCVTRASQVLYQVKKSTAFTT